MQPYQHSAHKIDWSNTNNYASLSDVQPPPPVQTETKSDKEINP